MCSGRLRNDELSRMCHHSLRRELKRGVQFLFRACTVLLLISLGSTDAAQDDRLPDTRPLEMEGDIASQMIDGITLFMENQSSVVRQSRVAYWEAALQGEADRDAFLQKRRDEFAQLIGLRDERVRGSSPVRVAPIDGPNRIADCESLDFAVIRWPTIGNIEAEAIMVEPRGKKNWLTVILVPDAGVHPAQLAWGEASRDSIDEFAMR